MNTPRQRLTPEVLDTIRQKYHDLAKEWNMSMTASTIEEYIKFMNICWEFLWKANDLESYLQTKSYILQRKIKLWHEKLDYENLETREKIVSWEYLLGFLLEDGHIPEYTIIATKSSFQKVLQDSWESLRNIFNPSPVNNGI